MWAPYLFGERTPHLDPEARAAFVGITASHTRGHFVRAVLEGVAFSLQDTFTLFRELGVPVKAIRLGGGGARGTAVAADSGGCIWASGGVAGGGGGWSVWCGSAGGTGVGVWPSVEAACAATVRVAETIAPKDAGVMEEAYERYRRMYPALREIGRACVKEMQRQVQPQVLRLRNGR